MFVVSVALLQIIYNYKYRLVTMHSLEGVNSIFIKASVVFFKYLWRIFV